MKHLGNDASFSPQALPMTLPVLGVPLMPVVKILKDLQQICASLLSNFHCPHSSSPNRSNFCICTALFQSIFPVYSNPIISIMTAMHSACCKNSSFVGFWVFFWRCVSFFLKDIFTWAYISVCLETSSAVDRLQYNLHLLEVYKRVGITSSYLFLCEELNLMLTP